MALKWRKKVVLIKMESVYGTDAVPTGAANAILLKNVEISPLEADVISRDLVRPTLGNNPQIHIGEHVMLKCDVELAGSGAAGTAPAYGPLLRACALAETITPATDVQYDPVSGNEESVTIYFHIDGQKHPMVGARGTMGIKLDPKGIPYLHFEFTGLWADPASAADPTPDFSAFQVPLAITNANTPTFTLHGLAAKCSRFSFDQNNTVVYDNLIGYEAVDINDRQPSGQVTIEAPDMTTKNYFTTVKANTLGTMQFVHGAVAGNIVQFDGAQVQLLKPNYSERNGKTMISMGLSYVPTDSGDDEFSLTIK